MAIINGPAGGGAFLHGTSPGGDTINAFGNGNSLYGDSGTNFLNILNGGNDNDLVGGPGIDHMDGGSGTGNIVSYQLSSVPVTASLANPSINTGDAAGDTYVNNLHALTGSPAGGSLYADNSGLPNQLWALGGTNSLFGGTGYTTFIGGPGADLMSGGSGAGFVDYETATAGVVASFINPASNTGYAAGDSYVNVHDLGGSGFDDVLTADNNNNNILGETGNDIINAGGGSDTLTGGPGADTLTGGSGSDFFVFNGAGTGVNDVQVDTLAVVRDAQAGIFDHITDFDQGNTGSYNVGESDRLDVAPLVSGLYNHGSGQPASSLVQVVEDASGTFALFQLDPDGSGPAGFVTMAKLDGIHSGDTVGVILDDSQSAGVALVVPGAAPPPPQPTSGFVDQWKMANGQWAGTIGMGSHGSDTAAIGDFNGDGTSDVAWFNSASGSVDEWQMANSNWAGSISMGSHPGTGWQMAGAGDFNGDGTSDVLFFNSSTMQTDIWQLANGKWAASVSPGSHPANSVIAGIGDFDHNGTSDILWFNPSTGDVDEWKIANGKWAGSVDIGSHPGSGWAVGGVGDFNSDGTSDVLWFNSGTGQTDIWELANGKWAASVSPGAHPTGVQVAGIGDFNNDGTSDILWLNPSTGQTDEWNISNGHWAGSADVGSHGANWQVAGIGDFNHDGTSDVLWHGL